MAPLFNGMIIILISEGINILVKYLKKKKIQIKCQIKHLLMT